MLKMYNQVRKVEIAYEDKSTELNTTETQHDIRAIVLDFKNLDINFNIEFQNTSKSNVCNIDIYNLSNSTIKKIKIGDPIRLTSGYEEFNGYIFIGKIDDILINKNKNDTLVKIICTPDVDSWNTTYISQSWNKNTKAIDVAKQVISLSNWKIGNLEMNDLVYKGGKVFRNNSKFCLEEIAKDTNSTLFFNNGIVYMYPKDKTFSKTIILKPSEGLLEAPTKQSNKSTKQITYRLKTALRHDYQEDVIVRILDSKYIDPIDLKIIKGVHKASDKEFYSELICQKLES